MCGLRVHTRHARACAAVVALWLVRVILADLFTPETPRANAVRGLIGHSLRVATHLVQRKPSGSPSRKTLNLFMERHDDDGTSKSAMTIPRYREARMVDLQTVGAAIAIRSILPCNSAQRAEHPRRYSYRGTMIIIPLNDRILVRSSRHASERRIAHLIPVPATAPCEHGTVIAVGTGALNGEGPLAIKAGDAVRFDGHIGEDVMFGGAEYVIMKAKDARRVEDVSAATSGQRDESRRGPQGADEPVLQPTWHGPHRIVVWST
jgi:chaperonin GroES